MSRFRTIILLPLFALLSGCNAVVLDPSGDVAVQQRDLLIQSTALMLLVIVPVMILTALFAWRYRQSNHRARYEPDWDHSTQLELVIWGAPLLIIICLGALTWMGTHLLDPYRPIDRIASGQPLSRETKRLEVEVVALDWKWLFIYPQYGIATVNELAAPVDWPIDFRITSSSVMNSFYIPALAGQVYAMAGMETTLHAVMNKPGTYEGFSANYSGAGFSGMHFAFRGLTEADFDDWIAKIRAAGGTLTRSEYLELEKPSENVPVHTYGTVDGGLYPAIVDMCVEPGQMCMSEMASTGGKSDHRTAARDNALLPERGPHPSHATAAGAEKNARTGFCSVDEAFKAPPVPPDTAPVRGAGLPRPPATSAGRDSAGLSLRPSNS